MFTHLDDPAPPPAAPEMAERALAEGRRRQRRRQAVLGGVTAALLLVVGAVGGLTVLRGDRGDGVVVAGRGDVDGGLDGADLGSPEFFRVLSLSVARIDPAGPLRAAVDPAEYQALWEAVGDNGAPPAADLRQDVVVSVTITDDACPPKLARFTDAGGVLTPVFEEEVRMCAQPLVGRTFVVALDRRSVGPSFTLRLPADRTYGREEQRLQVLVP